MKKKNHRKLIIALALVCVAIIGVIAVFMLTSGGNAGPALAQEVARTGDIESHYHFSGNVVVRDSENLTAKDAATVREVLVAEGTIVAKGDRLLRPSDGAIVKAGIDGEITKLHVKKDDDIQAGAALVDIVDFDHLSIEIKVDEFDIGAIDVGKEVLVTINARGNQYVSTITGFNKEAELTGDIAYYIATISTQDTEGLLPGMQIEAKVLNQSAQNATIISMSALNFDASNAPYVIVQSINGDAQNVYVTIGATDGVNAEITSGLRSGETVLVDPAKMIDAANAIGSGV